MQYTDSSGHGMEVEFESIPIGIAKHRVNSLERQRTQNQSSQDGLTKALGDLTKRRNDSVCPKNQQAELDKLIEQLRKSLVRLSQESERIGAELARARAELQILRIQASNNAAMERARRLIELQNQQSLND